MIIEKTCKKHGVLSRDNIIVKKGLLPTHKATFQCRLCQLQYQAKYQKLNSKEIIERAKEKRNANPEKHREHSRKCYERQKIKAGSPEYQRERRRNNYAVKHRDTLSHVKTMFDDILTLMYKKPTETALVAFIIEARSKIDSL